MKKENDPMDIGGIVASSLGWLRGQGPKDNIALSTRVRVARNLKGRTYVERATRSERKETLEVVMNGIRQSAALGKAFFISLTELDELDKTLLVERHLMSREHLVDPDHKGLIVGEGTLCSIMINEEDHLRMQVIMPGFDIMNSWKKLDRIEEKISEVLDFDYSPRFGYLTSCPTNTGTGLRVSCMLHLSALVMTSQIENVFDGISKLGMTIRGFYGEGTEAIGDFFQISNQVALGRSELDILDNLERIISKIIEREEDTRKKMLAGRREDLTDRVERSLGTLKTARIITSSEAIKLLSSVRLGIDAGIISEIDPALVNELLLFSQPAHLQKSVGKGKVAHYERDIKRADYIRKTLGVDR